MAKRIAGTCYFKVNGEQLELSGNLEFPLNQVTRESKMSTLGVAGFGETAATSSSLPTSLSRPSPTTRLSRSRPNVQTAWSTR